jgi:putative tricarboxylic transport membrane protein
MDRRIDLAIALVVVAFGAFVLYTAEHIRPTGPVVDPIGPRGFPYMIGVFFLVGGGVIAFSRLRAWRRQPGHTIPCDGEPDEPDVPASAAQAWTIMIASVLYALMLTTVGYIIATPLYVVVGLKAMRLRSWPTVLLTAAIYTLVTYVVFAVYMRVNLPVGPLTDLFRSVGLAR